MTIDLNRLTSDEILTLTLYGEARGEPIQGIIAVGCVIRNRCKKENKTYNEICLAPEQFSCWNSNDPNYPILITIANWLGIDSFDGAMRISRPIQINDEYYKQCEAVAIGIVDGNFIDNTHGSLNYVTYNLWISDKSPIWAKNFYLRIGNQMFGVAQ